SSDASRLETKTRRAEYPAILHRRACIRDARHLTERPHALFAIPAIAEAPMDLTAIRPSVLNRRLRLSVSSALSRIPTLEALGVKGNAAFCEVGGHRPRHCGPGYRRTVRRVMGGQRSRDVTYLCRQGSAARHRS